MLDGKSLYRQLLSEVNPRLLIQTLTTTAFISNIRPL